MPMKKAQATFFSLFKIVELFDGKKDASGDTAGKTRCMQQNRCM
jgi:hypothetical protein